MGELERQGELGGMNLRPWSFAVVSAESMLPWPPWPGLIQLVMTPPVSREDARNTSLVYPRLEWNGEALDTLHSERWGKSVRGIGRCLLDFVALADASPEDVLSFARKWGGLGISPQFRPGGYATVPSRRGFLKESDGVYWEPLEAWSRYTRQLRAILRVAAALHAEKPTETDDWRVIEAAEPKARGDTRSPRWLKHDRAADAATAEHLARLDLTFRVREWLWYANVQIGFQQADDEFFVTAAPTGLAGALGVQLAAAIASPLGVYRCDACGLPYMPSRKPQEGRSRFCPRETCGARAWNRASYRRHPRRKHPAL